MATRTIAIDPVTRLEGHLRVEIEVDGGAVKVARSSGTSFRGFEPILVGRDPRDAPQITQRICGVCPIPHGRASCTAFEGAAQIAVNDQARLVRNLVLAANFLDSHILHYYVLSLPDFIAGMPTAGAWPVGEPAQAWTDGVAALDAPAVAAHAVEALTARRRCHELIGMFGGKAPHPTGIVPGGATVKVKDGLKTEAASLAAKVRAFVDGSYAADVAAVAAEFPDYEEIGAAGYDFLSFGGFPEADGELLLPAGVFAAGGGTSALDPGAIREDVASARYEEHAPVHPSEGVTEPQFDKADAYTWIKSPRVDGRPCEVGPLARALLAGRDPGSRGVWGRHRARQAEASELAAALERWIEALVPGESALPVFPEPPESGSGGGLIEAPRGALGHWLTVEGGRIARYHVISPTTWNASPRDEDGQAGPMEQALAGVEVADAEDPVEVVRIIHSFDPCLQCAVH